MHWQIAVSALPHMPAAGRVHPHRMRILQVRSENRQRNKDRQDPVQLLFLFFVPRGRIPPVTDNPARHRNQQQKPCRRGMAGGCKSEEKSSQCRKPHAFQDAEAQSDPDPVQRLMPRQEKTDGQHAEGQIQQQIRQGCDHVFCPSSPVFFSSIRYFQRFPSGGASCD